MGRKKIADSPHEYSFNAILSPRLHHGTRYVTLHFWLEVRSLMYTVYTTMYWFVLMVATRYS